MDGWPGPGQEQSGALVGADLACSVGADGDLPDGDGQLEGVGPGSIFSGRCGRIGVRCQGSEGLQVRRGLALEGWVGCGLEPPEGVGLGTLPEGSSSPWDWTEVRLCDPGAGTQPSGGTGRVEQGVLVESGECVE